MLKITNLSVHYGRVRAVQNLTIEVNEGELIGLVGHNGAGKTTTLMTITGVLKPVAGAIVFNGRSLIGLSPDAILRARFARGEINAEVFERAKLVLGHEARSN